MTEKKPSRYQSFINWQMDSVDRSREAYRNEPMWRSAAKMLLIVAILAPLMIFGLNMFFE